MSVTCDNARVDSTSRSVIDSSDSKYGTSMDASAQCCEISRQQGSQLWITIRRSDRDLNPQDLSSHLCFEKLQDVDTYLGSAAAAEISWLRATSAIARKLAQPRLTK
jgi:hypothetical protein